FGPVEIRPIAIACTTCWSVAIPVPTRSPRRSGSDESPPSERADALRKTPNSESGSTAQPIGVWREVGGSRPSANAPITPPAAIAATVGIANASAATNATALTATSIEIWTRPRRAVDRIRSKVLVPPPADWVPTAIQERVSLASMPVNLNAMSVVGRAETPIFTWNPVEQMWVQEGGGATKPPPSPNDVHAIQTWFLDPDDHQWIQTVLGPMGRQ